MGPWVKSWLSQAEAMWWLWQSPRRTLLGGKEKGIWDNMQCWWGNKDPEKATEKCCDSFLVHLCALLSGTFHFLMWFKWTLVSYHQKSRKRCWHDTNLMMKTEWPIGKMTMSLNFFSWVGCYSNWCHGFRRNKQVIALKASTHVGPLSLCIIVFSIWFEADSLPSRSLHCKSDSYLLRPNLRILWPGSSLALSVFVWLIYQTRCCIWGN